MEPGDPLVIYRNETSAYHEIGRIGPFWHTSYVPDEFWNGGPALDVLAIESYTDINTSCEAVNRTLGYEKGVLATGVVAGRRRKAGRRTR